jgi:protein-histidine pros-kinase
MQVSLTARFNLALVITMVIGVLISGYLAYRMEMRQAQQRVVHEAELMLKAAQASRRYTSEQVAPLLEAIDHDGFVPQKVPSYAAQRTLEILREAYPDYSYREVAMNPTNLDDLPTAWEVQLIRDLRADASKMYVLRRRHTENGALHYLAQPIRITDAGCLECHGAPADAPPALLRTYGSVNGFGWRMDEVIGAQIVSVPMTLAYREAWRSVYVTVVTQVAVFAIAAVVINLMARWFFARPLRRLAEQAERRSRGDLAAPDLPPFATRELEALRRALDRLSRSVAKAIARLERRGEAAE